MVPVRDYSNWNERKTDGIEKREPKNKIYIIAEGAETERNYLRGFVDNYAKEFPNSITETIFLEKIGNDKGISNPKELIKLAEDQKEKHFYCEETDKMIIVFDADIYKDKEDDYKAILELGKKNGDILAITYPSFELFLLLHLEDGISVIRKYEEEILENKTKTKNKTFIYKLCNSKFGFDVKSKKSKVKAISNNLSTAIKNEKLINNDIYNCIGKLTSNVAQVLDSIIKENK